MMRSDDAWPLPVLFAILALLLAKSMASEQAPSAVVEKVVSCAPAPVTATEPYDPDRIPSFSLKDPLGKLFTSEGLYKSTGILVMITVPNLSHWEKQKKWEKYFNRQRWPQHCAPQRVLIEDLSQQQAYRDKARSMMRQSYKPDGDTVVLIDETGDVRRNLGVNNDETVILLIDNKGHIRHMESDDVEPDEPAARRLASEVNRLAEQTAQSQPPAVTLAASVRK